MSDLSAVSDAQLMAMLNAATPPANSTPTPAATLASSANAGANVPVASVASSGNASTGNGAPSDLPTDLAAINKIETGGASDSATGIVNAASGARGSMQVMPTTATNPGFGVTPSNGTPQDDARTGRDYYAALRQKYGAPDLAAIAYDWGPGNTDNWLANGADPSQLPAETLKYVLKFQGLTGYGDSSNSNGAQGGAPAANVGTQPSGPKGYFPGVSDVIPPIPQANPNDSAGLVANVQKDADALASGAGQTGLGLVSLAGRGLSAIGAPTAGDFLANTANTAAANLGQQYQDLPGNSTVANVANIAGRAAPMFLAGPELLPQVGSGALYSASDASVNNQPIIPATIEGAGLGALGFGAGKAIEAAAPAVAGFIAPRVAAIGDTAGNILNGGEQTATANIANLLGPDADQVIQNLRDNSNEIIPGSSPTAAEAGNNTQLVAYQRALQNTKEGQIAFTDQLNANNAARIAAGDATVGANLPQEVDDFTNAQAARIQAGQTELPPISQAQADIMQTPAYIQAMKTASTAADNSGSSVFAEQQIPLQQSLSQSIDSIAGTPATLDALKAARGAGADETFRSANISIPVDSPEFQTLLQKPAFTKAMNTAQDMSDNLNEGSLYTTTANRAAANLGGAKAAPVTYVAGRGLLYAKGVLDDQITRAIQLGENAKARPLMAVRNDLLNVMDAASPEYAAARADFQAASGPIDAQVALQKRLNGAVDPITGQVSANRLRQTINSVHAEQLKPGIREADQVPANTLDQLGALAQQAKLTPTDMTGLAGEGQEYLRQALQSRAGTSGNSLVSREANLAHENFNRYLANQSDSYKQYLEQASTTGADLRSREALQAGLQKIQLGAHNTAGDPILTLNGAKSLAQGSTPLTGAAKAHVDGLIADLTRASAANNALGAAGSQTYANAQLGGGLLGRFMQSAVHNLPLGGGLSHGLTGFIGGQAMDFAISRAAEKTEKAAISLLLDPKKLANALEEFQGNQVAREAYIDALKQKAAGAGKAGVRAVQLYEVEHAKNKGR